jgi:uncharacterized protein
MAVNLKPSSAFSSEMNYREVIAEYIQNEALPVDKFGHQPRLYALTQKVGQGQEYDDDVVYAATWLHDLGVFYGHRPADPEQLRSWNNTAYACEKAPGLLGRFGFPLYKIPAVVETMRTHEAKAFPTSMEGTILRDADILEQLGAIGILRASVKVGRDTRFSTFSEVLPVLEAALQNLPSALMLPLSQKLAAEKIELLSRFIAAVKQEAVPALY